MRKPLFSLIIASMLFSCASTTSSVKSSHIQYSSKESSYSFYKFTSETPKLSLGKNIAVSCNKESLSTIILDSVKPFSSSSVIVNGKETIADFSNASYDYIVSCKVNKWQEKNDKPKKAKIAVKIYNTNGEELKNINISVKTNEDVSFHLQKALTSFFKNSFEERQK